MKPLLSQVKARRLHPLAFCSYFYVVFLRPQLWLVDPAISGRRPCGGDLPQRGGAAAVGLAKGAGHGGGGGAEVPGRLEVIL